MPFGQIVIGPPGCGKTTYCHGLAQFYDAIERPHAIINLDPGNEAIRMKNINDEDDEDGKRSNAVDIDVRDLISLEEAMDEFDLGPNGALIYCMEYLEENMDWLLEMLEGWRVEWVGGRSRVGTILWEGGRLHQNARCYDTPR